MKKTKRDYELEAILQAKERWQQRADLGYATKASCPLCDFGDDDCAICPYYLVYGDCVNFKGYRVWNFADYEPDNPESEAREGARLCVARLQELYEEWLVNPRTEDEEWPEQ